MWKALATTLLILEMQNATADFHAWQINEVYSNADGSVQFIEMTCDQSGETALGGQRLYCSRAGQTNVFTVPTDLSGETRNKRLLFATPGFGTLPGGIQPNYTVPRNFVFLPNGRVNWANVDTVTYTNLPKNGVASLVRSGSSLVPAAANSPRNFAGHAGSIVPVRISSSSHVGNRFLLSFNTATGKSYSVEFKNALTNSGWQTLITVNGNGSAKTVTNNNIGSIDERFYRLRAQ